MIRLLIQYRFWLFLGFLNLNEREKDKVKLMHERLHQKISRKIWINEKKRKAFDEGFKEAIIGFQIISTNKHSTSTVDPNAIAIFLASDWQLTFGILIILGIS